jgi:hypothetical protein
MGLFGGPKQPQPLRRRRRKKTWLEKEAAGASDLVEKAKLKNPALQAAIIHQATGVDIKAADIKAETPEDILDAKVMTAALEDIEKDPEFMEQAKAAALDRMYARGPSGRRRFQRGGGDGEYEGIPYGYGYGGPQDPLEMVRLVRELETELKGGGALSRISDSPVLIKLIETVVPALLGKQGPPPAGPAIVSVEVDGELVEMTRAEQ